MDDEASYRDFFRELSSSLSGSAGVREGWVGYLYHVTGIENAVSILNHGAVFSRAAAEKIGCMVSDHASSDVIAGTADEVKSYARLYFRPKTPTFFVNEGFKTQDEIEQGTWKAHCPIPVALVFDAAKVLALPGTKFSGGTLAARDYSGIENRTFSGLDSLRKLPFGTIYHSTPLPPSEFERREIKKRRHAEVIVPDSLALAENLRAVICRSDAELRTLRYLYRRAGNDRYRRITRTNVGQELFCSHRFFVDKVQISNGQLVVDVHTPLSMPKKPSFDATLTIDYPDVDSKSQSYSFELDVAKYSDGKMVSRPNLLPANDIWASIKLELDGNIAYWGSHWLGEDAILVGQ